MKKLKSRDPQPKKKYRSRGAAALRRCGVTYAEIGRRMGVAASTVTWYLDGRCKPSPAARKKLFDLFGVEITWWDQVYTPAHANDVPPGKAKAEKAPQTTMPTTPLGLITFLEEQVNQQLDEMRSPEALTNYTPMDRARVFASAGNTLEKIAKAREAFEVARQEKMKVWEAPSWHLFKTTLLEVLRKFPECLAAVEIEFRKVEAERIEEIQNAGKVAAE